MKLKTYKCLSKRKVVFVTGVLAAWVFNPFFLLAKDAETQATSSWKASNSPEGLLAKAVPVGPLSAGESFPQTIANVDILQPDEAKDISEVINDNGEKISLDLKGVDITELLRIFSLKMKLTIVPSKGTSGRINVFLNNLTFKDALDVVLISQDLACDRKGDIIYVMTASEYEALYGKKYNEKRQSKTLKLQFAKPATVFNALSQLKSEIGKIIVDEATGTVILVDTPGNLKTMEGLVKDLDKPLETEIFDIQYAKSADVKAHLGSAITVGPGELFVDERSSKVIVSDLPDKMKKIERIMKAVDEESRQVFIEGEILQVTLKKEYQSGIDWEYVFSQKRLHGLDLVGKFPASPSFTPSPDLSAANQMKVTVGTVAADDYTAALQFLQTFGDTKILSRPRIMAINNQEAKIMVGSREAYISQTLSQAEASLVTSESVQFIDVGVKLNVVPMINRDGFITMKIKPEVSSVRETITTALNSTIPIVETSEAETVVKVKDGTMIMIAGLMKDDKRKDRTGIPGLSRIPILGALFGSRASLDKMTEIIIFITPHIVSGEATPKGTEPEKLLSPDILPDDLKASIVAQKKNRDAPFTEKDSASVIIQRKMKGIKSKH